MIVGDLPHPGRERWQPLRAGLVELFHYEAEEFWFRDGRLLLRGNNGTGKSKVLALMLPFLLDADLSPHRVEPDGDRKKKMEWNLLLGGAHPSPERTGYSWLEFGRIDEDGEPRFVTIGAGLKAVSQRGITRHWYFITEQRVGETLWLVDAARVPLGKDRLTEAIGPEGLVTENAGQYRRAVDEALFGLGEERYRALVELLIQLRQPQLSKRPDEQGLSRALTEALPPVPQEVVADVAEAFHSLDEDRDELERLRRASRAVDDFIGDYRAYAQVAAKNHARGPRDAQSEYERANTALAAAELRAREAEQAVAAVEARMAGLSDHQLRLNAERDALYTGELADAADKLEGARVERDRASASLGEASEDLARAEGALASSAEAEGAALALSTVAREGFGRALRSLAESTPVLGPTEATATRRLDGIEALVAADDVTAAVAELRELTAGRHHAITGLRRQLTALGEVEAELGRARVGQEVAESAASAVEVRLAEADDAVSDAGLRLLTRYREQFFAAVELRAHDTEPLAAALAETELWTSTLAGPDPARRYADELRDAVRARLSALSADAERRRGELDERAAALGGRIRELESDIPVEPDPVPTRDVSRRVGRPGAPLWRLIDFHDDVSAEDRAGIEGALEASGLLDAWLTPEGDLLDAWDDAYLADPDGLPAEPSLAEVLTVAIDFADPAATLIDPSRVSDVLAAIGFVGPGASSVHPSWIGADGRYALGALRGHWHKPEAQHIGELARVARRRLLLAEARAELETVAVALARVGDELAAVVARSAVLDRELRELPDAGELRSAHSSAEAARILRAQAGEELASARSRVDQEHRRVEASRGEVAETAADLGLPADTEELEAITGSLAEFTVALAGIVPSFSAAATADRAESAARRSARSAEDEWSRVTARHELRRQAFVAAEQTYATLEASVGVEVAELQRRREGVAIALAEVDRDLTRAGKQKEDALESRGGARSDVTQERERSAERAESRRLAAATFQSFVRTGLIAAAVPELELPDPDADWAPDPTVRLARRVDGALTDVADELSDWNRVQRRLEEAFGELEEVLSAQGNSAARIPQGDVVVVEVVYAGRPATPAELSAVLATEAADRGRLLTEREREILENYLVDEVASTLQDLIQQADLQVERMNRELTGRPTSTGMRLRLQWLPSDDSPDGFDEARRRILRQKSDAWSTQDRETIGAFLQRRIDQFRTENEAGTWLEQLRDAFDYRSWNRFVVQIHQNGQWRSASGPASGGERVLAASVPLFAAASAHYGSAGNPHAPRIITLDEAFAGVDDRARADYLGLLAAFDLDVVMTSEREWACYPQVPGIAIAQLSRVEGVDAVHVERWEWDGRERSSGTTPVLSAIGAGRGMVDDDLGLEGLE